MESRLSLPAEGAELPVRLEPQGEAAYETAAGSHATRNKQESACPFREVAGCGADLEVVTVATAASMRARGIGAKKTEQAHRASRRQRWPQVLIFAVAALCLVGVTLLHVWLRLQVVHMGYLLSTTSKLQNQLEQENRELKVELATLTSPDRLEAMARKRLGLVPPEKGQVVILP